MSSTLGEGCCDTLGEGCCGTVRKGFHKGTEAAIKSVLVSKTDAKDLRREHRIYLTLNHKNVVKLLGRPAVASHCRELPVEFLDGKTLRLIFPKAKLLGHPRGFEDGWVIPERYFKKCTLGQLLFSSDEHLPWQQPEAFWPPDAFTLEELMFPSQKWMGPRWVYEDVWQIPLEFIDGCTLEELLFPLDKLSTADKDRIIFGMCDGLRYLHSQNVVHQDLKPNNIMVRRSTKEAVIIDLGLAKFVNYTQSGKPFSSGKNKGFREYAAPETKEGNIRTRKSDVWSMGKVIAEVILGSTLPWDDCSPENVNNLLCGSKYASIVFRMLEKDQLNRVSMEDVVNQIQSFNTLLTCAEGINPLDAGRFPHSAGEV